MNANRVNFILNILVALMMATVLAVSSVLAYELLRYDIKMQQNGKLDSIAIEGEYSEEGGPWKLLTPKTTFRNLDLRDITLRGHFTKDIPQGKNLYLNIDHMRVSLWVNGKEIYRLVPEKGNGNLTQATGKQYVTIVSSGITTEDAVELNFGNLYRNAYMIQFDELLWQMHIGDGRMMLFEAIREDSWPLGIGAIFLFLTLFLIIISVCCAVLRVRGALRFLWLGLAAFFSALWFFTLSPALTLIFPLPIFLNVLYTFSMQCMAMCLVLFLITNLSGWRRQLMMVCEGVLLLTLLVALVNQLLSIQDLYSAIIYFSFFDIAAVLSIAFCLWYEAYYLKKTESATLLKMLSIPIFCVIAELANGFFQFFEAAFLLGFGLISFTIAEGIYMLHRINRSMKNEKRALILEQELNQNRIAIMLSQIQPHFLYNALNTIRYLCKRQPEQAEKAIESFSGYLRGNMDSITRVETIPFSQELAHLENYLVIERLRFPEICIVYDLQAQNFWLPTLTVQPLVDNAIHHGVLSRDEGGTVKISSREDQDTWYVCVEDDGMGFDIEQTFDNNGRSHIGIHNTRSRLEAMCGGKLIIESTEGIGTVATISIPKEEAK